MSKMESAGASQAQIKLMEVIGHAVMQHTTFSPMAIEDIVTVLAYAAGSSIGQKKSFNDRKRLRDLAAANLDHGIDAAKAANASPIILPN